MLTPRNIKPHPELKSYLIFRSSNSPSGSPLLRRGGQIRAFQHRSSPGRKFAFVDKIQYPNRNANFLASLYRCVIEVEKHKKLTLLPVLRSGY